LNIFISLYIFLGFILLVLLFKELRELSGYSYRQESRYSIPARRQIILFSIASRPDMGPIQPPPGRGITLEVKQSMREADHTPLYIHSRLSRNGRVLIQCTIKHDNNFAFFMEFSSLSTIFLFPYVSFFLSYFICFSHFAFSYFTKSCLTFLDEFFLPEFVSTLSPWVSPSPPDPASSKLPILELIPPVTPVYNILPHNYIPSP
jgi:hypothetical protein